ncbi:unnamed protein product [Effrenium voratum]|nr:unnamed protein product [Effrenium voratum]
MYREHWQQMQPLYANDRPPDDLIQELQNAGESCEALLYFLRRRTPGLRSPEQPAPDAGDGRNGKSSLRRLLRATGDAMKILLHLVAACFVSADVVQEAPGRALKLLSQLQEQVAEEGSEAEQVFGEEKKLCSRRSRELRYSHEDVKAEEEKSEADLAQAKLELEASSNKIEELAMTLASDEADLQEAEKLRAQEAGVFAEAEKGLVSTVDALDRALAIVGHEQRKVYKSEALLQTETSGSFVDAFSAIVEASSVALADRQRLVALAQGSQKDVSAEDAEDSELNDALGLTPTAYQSKSSSLVTVLNEVLEKAQTELEKLRREEQEKLHSYQLLRQSQSEKMKYAKRDMAAAQERKGDAAQRIAASEGSLAEAQRSVAETVAALQDLQGTCLKKATKFEEDTQGRAEEVKALQEAKEAIEAKLGGGRAASFLQLGRGSRASEDHAAAAARSVRRLAVRLDSPALIELAGRLDFAASHRLGRDDPLRKVRGLIEGMIASMQSQAAAEADHQAFCDKEMSTTGIKSADRQEDVEKLGTKLEQARAQVTHLTEQTATLRQELADLAETQAEMDQVRKQEQSLFDTSQRDAKDGMEGLRLALQVLRTFYAKIGDPAGRGKQVVSMLEYVKSDIHKRVTSLEAEEQQAAAEYQRVSKDNAVMQATKQHDVDANTADLSALKKMLNELGSDHAAAKEELDALQAAA